jgi:hypothetical protein
MPAYARLKGETFIFPDAAKMLFPMGQPPGAPANSVILQRQNNEQIALIRLGDGDFVTVGNEPQYKADAAAVA